MSSAFLDQRGFPVGRGLFEGWHIVILGLVVVALFGWKKMPDAARSLGRSMRIFKSEIDEMKRDDKAKPSAASSDTVKGETVPPATDPIQDPTRKPATDPTEREKHDQPPA
jgi:sec-independent protein translocase protein TatA